MVRKAMSRTRLLATGIDPNTKDAVLHLASFFTGPLGCWWTTTIRNVDDTCGNFGSVAELEAAAMSLHYIRDRCRTAYHKLSKLKQTGSVHQFKQALEELHFHIPERSAKCKLYDFIEGLIMNNDAAFFFSSFCPVLPPPPLWLLCCIIVVLSTAMRPFCTTE